jgi:hypothetical protein
MSCEFEVATSYIRRALKLSDPAIDPEFMALRPLSLGILGMIQASIEHFDDAWATAEPIRTRAAFSPRI